MLEALAAIVDHHVPPHKLLKSHHSVGILDLSETGFESPHAMVQQPEFHHLLKLALGTKLKQMIVFDRLNSKQMIKCYKTVLVLL